MKLQLRIGINRKIDIVWGYLAPRICEMEGVPRSTRGHPGNKYNVTPTGRKM